MGVSVPCVCRCWCISMGYIKRGIWNVHSKQHHLVCILRLSWWGGNATPHHDDKDGSVKVMITGSRDWKNRGPIEAMIRGFSPVETEFCLGDCPTGVDAIANKVCSDGGYTYHEHVAKWNEHGKPAGPMRNTEMVKCGADVCFAFRTEGISEGTDDCVYQANVAGIPTYIMRKMPDLKETDYVVPGINFKRKAKNHG